MLNAQCSRTFATNPNPRMRCPFVQIILSNSNRRPSADCAQSPRWCQSSNSAELDRLPAIPARRDAESNAHLYRCRCSPLARSDSACGGDRISLVPQASDTRLRTVALTEAPHDAPQSIFAIFHLRAVQFAGRSTGQGDSNALTASVPRVLDHRPPHRHSCARSTSNASKGIRCILPTDRFRT
jgi:hypothetical protein